MCLLAVRANGWASRPEALGGDGRRPVIGQRGKYDRELVTPEPCHRIRVARAVLQTPSDLTQQQIPDVVPERVVDVLEIVQIDQQQGGETSIAPCLRHRPLQPILEQQPVRQARQDVVMGEVVNLRLGLDPSGDVPLHGHEMGDRSAACPNG